MRRTHCFRFLINREDNEVGHASKFIRRMTSMSRKAQKATSNGSAVCTCHRIANAEVLVPLTYVPIDPQTSADECALATDIQVGHRHTRLSDRAQPTPWRWRVGTVPLTMPATRLYSPRLSGRYIARNNAHRRLENEPRQTTKAVQFSLAFQRKHAHNESSRFFLRLFSNKFLRVGFGLFGLTTRFLGRFFLDRAGV
jgi:hypothetical protein